MPKLGERRVIVCKATGKPVLMEYEGKGRDSSGGANGHKRWLCLHNEDPEQDRIETEAFNAATL